MDTAQEEEPEQQLLTQKKNQTLVLFKTTPKIQYLLPGDVSSLVTGG